MRQQAYLQRRLGGKTVTFIIVMNDKNVKNHEHILVCLSASPSNARIVKTAYKMSRAFGGVFSALYVETRSPSKYSEDDNARLQESVRLAEKFGAQVTTVYGDDIAAQIAEFALLSGVTKIVIGRSNSKRGLHKQINLTEKLAKAGAQSRYLHYSRRSNGQALSGQGRSVSA